jgi:beta-xylosidase
MNTKHLALLAAAFAAALFTLAALAGDEEPAAKARRVDQARLERIPTADLGNGHFRNPVLVGPGADNAVIRVDKDFYMLVGGNILWNSRDLVNWRPYAKVPTSGLELTYCKGRYYIYSFRMDPSQMDLKYASLSWSQRTLLGTTSRTGGDHEFSTFVSWADKPEGPWSTPTDIGFYGMIDPGHVADQQGNRYLFHNMGLLVNLTPDGLQAVGDVRKVYQGWQYPKDWPVECFCLEAPKLVYHNGYYYMSSAEGGTAGPATAHMGVTARAKSIEGPWENSPYNPMVHTYSRDEKWWRQGHGTLIDDIAGNWWFVYTAYENGYVFMGKQAMVLPVEWTADGWPRVKPGVRPTDAIPKPAGENMGNGLPLSDDFTGDSLGMQWRAGRGGRGGAPVGAGATGRGAATPNPAGAAPAGRGAAPTNARVGGGALRLTASGKSAAEAAAVSITPGNHDYMVEVEVTAPDTAEAGFLLSGSTRSVNAGIRKGEAFAFWQGVPVSVPWKENRLFVRIRNNSGDVSVSYSADGKQWTPFDNSTTAPGVRSISLYAAGEGEVVFRNFKYRAFD